MEFRFLEEEANSGIFVRTGPTSNDDERGWPNNGYQIQCMDIITGDTPLGNMIPSGAPPFDHEFDIEALQEAYNPTGEWQTYEITAEGENLSVRLNGGVGGWPFDTSRQPRRSRLCRRYWGGPRVTGWGGWAANLDRRIRSLQDSLK